MSVESWGFCEVHPLLPEVFIGEMIELSSSVSFLRGKSKTSQLDLTMAASVQMCQGKDSLQYGFAAHKF